MCSVRRAQRAQRAMRAMRVQSRQCHPRVYYIQVYYITRVYGTRDRSNWPEAKRTTRRVQGRQRDETERS